MERRDPKQYHQMTRMVAQPQQSRLSQQGGKHRALVPESDPTDVHLPGNLGQCGSDERMQMDVLVAVKMSERDSGAHGPLRLGGDFRFHIASSRRRRR